MSKLLKAGLDFVLENPDDHDQQSAHSCIIGHALNLADISPRDHYFQPSLAAPLLGLTRSQFNDVFGCESNQEAIEIAQYVVAVNQDQEAML